MGIIEIRKLKEAKTGTVLNVAEAREFFKTGKLGANKMEGKFHSGQYECSKGLVHFRSMWEANYALYLDWLKEKGEIKDWEYETETYVFDGIKSGTRTYRIDFKVWLNDTLFEIHEIKGYMDAKSKTKLKRMKKYHPKVKVVLIERAFYMDMLKKLKGVIKFHK